MDALQASEIATRLSFFVIVFGLVAMLEQTFPRLPRRLSRRQRWPSNISVSLINQLFTRLVLPASAVVLATSIEAKHWGLLGQLDGPRWLEILGAIQQNHLLRYLQHRLFQPLLFQPLLFQ